MKFLDKLFGTQVEGSSFGRLADADTRIKEAQGKIVAVKDSIAAKQGDVAALKSNVLELHEKHDVLDSDLDQLHSLLG